MENSYIDLATESRCGISEVVHQGCVSVADAMGKAVFAGPHHILSPLRSLAKPFILNTLLQTVLAEESYSSEELAIMMSSHNGEPRHVAAVRGLLDRYSISENNLVCGTHEAYAKDSDSSQIGNQCSGKHTLFLIASRVAGYPLEDYRNVESPLQKLIIPQIAHCFKLQDVLIGTDGCSIPTYASPINNIASGYLSFALQEFGPTNSIVIEAMFNAPFLIGGTDTLDSYLLSKYKILAKSGSDGVWCIASPKNGVAIAAKSISGSEWAAQAAILECASQMDLLPVAKDPYLSRYHNSIRRDLVGNPVGFSQACTISFQKS